MRPEIRSITLYVRESHFEMFLQGQYDKVVWTLTSGDPVSSFSYISYKQVQVQVSVDTYQNLLDARAVDSVEHTPPF